MANIGTRLECQKCGEIVTLQGPGEIPACGCGAGYWRTLAEASEPTTPYVVTANDRRLLRKLHIDADQ